jgi:hypothetical protein|tara:strand:+ start:210 stop:425 length:216 start_codon:yes stop_codon:yes gene_type:complete
MDIERLADPFEEQSARHLRNNSRHITMNNPKEELRALFFILQIKVGTKRCFLIKSGIRILPKSIPNRLAIC